MRAREEIANVERLIHHTSIGDEVGPRLVQVFSGLSSDPRVSLQGPRGCYPTAL
jgi:hypothetical protein